MSRRTPTAVLAALAAFGLLALLAAAGGCGDDRGSLREWRPSDHQPPENAESTATGEQVPSADDPALAQPQQPPEDPADQEARAVAALWGVMCASCHGRAGQGDGPARPPGVTIADMTNAAWQGSHSDEAMAEAIRVGKPPMPAFGQQVNDRGVAALVAHIRRLGETGGAAGP